MNDEHCALMSGPLDGTAELLFVIREMLQWNDALNHQPSRLPEELARRARIALEVALSDHGEMQFQMEETGLLPKHMEQWMESEVQRRVDEIVQPPLPM